ncbi:MAG: hypothetical protein R3D63_07555 [Paracoccaceae bacterium]
MTLHTRTRQIGALHSRRADPQDLTDLLLRACAGLLPGARLEEFLDRLEVGK